MKDKIKKIKYDLEHNYTFDDDDNILNVLIGGEEFSLGLLEEILDDAKDYDRMLQYIKDKENWLKIK